MLVKISGGPHAGQHEIDRFRHFLCVKDDEGRWCYYRLTWRVDTVPKSARRLKQPLARYAFDCFKEPDSVVVSAVLAEIARGEHCEVK